MSYWTKHMDCSQATIAPDWSDVKGASSETNKLNNMAISIHEFISKIVKKYNLENLS